ncbi:MAG: flippase [Candidatus Cloacimonetes bacterium]|nr:flippase [Candidatus Cloacimonadota bacterium]
MKFIGNIQTEHKTVISNTFSLIILQGSNYIIPLILFPYLVHVLGIEYFGVLSFASATVALLRGIVDYGFKLSGTQQISVNRNDLQKVSEIFSSIFVVKIILTILVFAVLLLLILFINKVSSHFEVFLYTFLLVIGDVLFSAWFFQGMEKMKLITYFNIVYKTLYLVSVFLFVRQPSDYVLVPLFYGIGAVFMGIVAFIFLKNKFNISIKLPKYSDIIYQFKNSRHVFLSQITVHLYTSFNTFVLGLMVSPQAVGYYAIAFKIYGAIRGLLVPVNQALFPYISRKFVQSKLYFYRIIKKISIVYSIVLAILAIILFFFSNEIVTLISGEQISESVTVLKILSIAILFAVGGFYSSLLVLKLKSHDLFKVTFYTMIVNIVLIYPTIHFLGINGLALQVLVVQMVHFCLQIKYNIDVWKTPRIIIS